MNAPLLRLTCVALLGLGLAACKPTPPPTDEPPEPKVVATTAPEANELHDAIQQPIEQAKAVEGNVQEAADQQAATIDAATK